MSNSYTTLTIIAIFVMPSCVTRQHLFIDQMFAHFDQLKINKVEQFEKRNRSKNSSRGQHVDIAEGIYPNKNRYPLAPPMTFTRREKPGFRVEIDYYYVLADSSVKVILYQWDDLGQENAMEKSSRFQSRFNQLNDSLTKILGQPTAKNIEQAKVPFGETFRNDIKWQSGNGLHAYLFMFGNDKSGYRQIRLAIYPEERTIVTP